MKNTYVIFIIIIIALLAFVFFGTNRISPPGDVVSTDTTNQDESMGNLTLTSSAFEHNGKIPAKYTCDDENINPPLVINGVPEGAQSLVLIMDDPDIPQQFKDDRGTDSFDHWPVFNISPDTVKISENTEPEGTAGLNGRGESGYIGPCPPSEFEPTEHRYFFKLFALDITLSLKDSATKADVEKAIDGHILEQTELIGLYERQ